MLWIIELSESEGAYVLGMFAPTAWNKNMVKDIRSNDVSQFGSGTVWILALQNVLHISCVLYEIHCFKWEGAFS